MNLFELAKKHNTFKFNNIALSEVITQGLPSRHIEMWRTSPLNLKLKQKFNFLSTPTEMSTSGLNTLKKIESDSERDRLANLITQSQHFKSHFSSTVGLALTVDTEAYEIDGERLVTIDKNYISQPSSDHHLTATTYLFKVKSGSDATLLLTDHDHHVSPMTSFDQVVIHLEKSAKLEIVLKSHLSLQHNSFKNISIYLEDDAALNSVFINQNCHYQRVDLHVTLAGKNSIANIYGLNLCDKEAHYDMQSLVEHQVGENESHQLIKTVAVDHARSSFTGKINIKKDAQKVNASQMSRNLIVGEKAQIQSQPQLAIYADDVKCAHGSSTGRMNDDELFYLTSRGIEAEHAKAMLNRGFVLDIVQKIKNQEVQSLITSSLEIKQ